MSKKKAESESRRSSVGHGFQDYALRQRGFHRTSHKANIETLKTES
jgi:hypothetical protein